MSKIITGTLVMVVLVAGGFYFLNSYIYNEKQAVSGVNEKNAEYVIEGQKVKLVNGESSVESAPGSASKIVTKYFGNDLRVDLNNDGRIDVVFLLTQSGGGTGTFYYVVAALNTENGYLGSSGLLLGDRIAPQTTEMSKNPSHVNVIVVNYADRKPGESFDVRPSLGKSIWLKLDPETRQFGEVVQNFEGEADTSKMKLSMKTWNWIRAEYNDGRVVAPKTAGSFTITFTDKGTFSAKTDCNSVGGSYTLNQMGISFKNILSTLMYCEGSQESDFTKLLQNTSSYHFTSKGELIFDLKFDSGSVVFN